MNNLQPKAYDIAFLCGRFQLMHIGHESLVNTALKMCDRIIILVGSAQESGTIRNPFDIETRIKMIREIYPQDSIIVKPLSDLSKEDDITPEWGKYVLNNVKKYVYKTPELMIYGNDESRSRWFNTEDIKDVTEIIVPRSRLPISATELRRALVEDNKEMWFKYHNPRLHKYYDILRGELLAAKPYGNMHKEMINANQHIAPDYRIATAIHDYNSELDEKAYKNMSEKYKDVAEKMKKDGLI